MMFDGSRIVPLFANRVQAAFIYCEMNPMVYDVAGADIGIDPHTVTSDSSGDVDIKTSLTVLSGLLTMNSNTSWGDAGAWQLSAVACRNRPCVIHQTGRSH
jgi:hypothetical protein